MNSAGHRKVDDMKTYTLTEHQMLCILDALQEALPLLKQYDDSLIWACAFESANEVREILGKQPLVEEV